ncbi:MULTISPECIES: hypothetical protein [Sphingobacterium]|jgi:hypothetical protein|uniref:hypothetical protein n=1 Tax=Sphingobacterium TaxID=28453 RepID=UPI00257E1936|nr:MULTISPECIES: hypothetical protein [Sphingobacterium]
MFKIKLAFLLAMSAVLLVSCGINKSAQTNTVKADCKEISGKTNIRIKNNSQYTLENVTVTPSEQKINFGKLEKGTYSCYHSFEKAYRYAYVKVTIEGKEYELTPIDYVGEKELGAGSFTYVLEVDKSNEYAPLKIKLEN